MRGLLAALFFVALGAQAQEYEARSDSLTATSMRKNTTGRNNPVRMVR